MPSRLISAAIAASFLAILLARTAVAAQLEPIDLKPVLGGSAVRKRYTIELAVASSLQNYPRIRVRLEQAAAAKARILLTKEQEYVPKILSTWEEVAASHNKLTQILFGDPVLPPNPGPGLPYQTWRGNWFSGAGVLMDWNPIDFGLHKAKIAQSRAEYVQSESNVSVTQLDVATNAASSYLNLLLAQEQQSVALANVTRMQTVRDIVAQLVSAGLRPGVDESLADAQLAEMRNTLIEAQEHSAEMQAALALAIGDAGSELDVDPRPIEVVEGPPVMTVAVADFAVHPLVVAQRSVIGTLVAQKNVISKSVYPNLRFLAGTNWRGSGLDIHAKFQKKDAFGLWPEVYNWNVGVMLNWNALDFVQLHQQKVVQDRLILAQRAEYAQIIQNLKEQDQRSRAMLEAAIKLAQNTPIQVAAAREAESRARTRYETGLGNIEDIANAESLLAKAEMTDAAAKVAVWKALLVIANNHGSINGFLQQVAAARTNAGM